VVFIWFQLSVSNTAYLTDSGAEELGLSHTWTRCHAIAKTTARCAQYMSALKIVCKHKSSRRLRKNLHITILSLFGGEIIFEVFQQM